MVDLVVTTQLRRAPEMTLYMVEMGMTFYLVAMAMMSSMAVQATTLS